MSVGCTHAPAPHHLDVRRVRVSENLDVGGGGRVGAELSLERVVALAKGGHELFQPRQHCAAYHGASTSERARRRAGGRARSELMATRAG